MLDVEAQARPLHTRTRHVAIEAQITPGEEGGLEPYLHGLIDGLAASAGAGWRYSVVRSPDYPPFPAVSGPAVLDAPRTRPTVNTAERSKRLLGRLRHPAGRLWRRALRATGAPAVERTQPVELVSDGFWERLGADVVHFPYVLHYERTEVPSVLTVHDLQHLHFPEFFPTDQFRWREQAYPRAMQHARVVVASSEWVRRDIVARYGLPDDKVHTAHLASQLPLIPPDDRPAAIQRVRRRFDLPERFAIYPAMTYGHKNHVRLIDAVASLRAQGRVVQVVCPGRQRHRWPEIEQHLERRGLAGSVRFLGFVSTDDLSALFASATCLVFPSLFEGAGLPVIEAMAHGLPVACSRIPPLEEYAGSAAQFFDPLDVDDMAKALWDLFEDDQRQVRLRSRGLERVRRFSIAQLAARHQELYALADRESRERRQE